MAVWPWYGALAKGQLYEAGEFLQVQEYTHVLRWTDDHRAAPGGAARPAVNRTWGQPASQLHERHDASDFDTQPAVHGAGAGHRRRPGAGRQRRHHGLGRGRVPAAPAAGR
jgi:hypothetical protein